jgi:hypothetical protein
MLCRLLRPIAAAILETGLINVAFFDQVFLPQQFLFWLSMATLALSNNLPGVAEETTKNGARIRAR